MVGTTSLVAVAAAETTTAATGAAAIITNSEWPKPFRNNNSESSSSLYLMFSTETINNDTGNGNFIDITLPQPIDEPKNPVTNVIIVVCFSLLIVVSLAGNCLVVRTLFKQRGFCSNSTNVLIGVLAISDLMMTTFNIPFTVADIILQDWIFGDFFCILVSFVQANSVYVSSFTMAVIAIDRCKAIYKFRPAKSSINNNNNNHHQPPPPPPPPPLPAPEHQRQDSTSINIPDSKPTTSSSSSIGVHHHHHRNGSSSSSIDSSSSHQDQSSSSCCCSFRFGRKSTDSNKNSNSNNQEDSSSSCFRRGHGTVQNHQHRHHHHHHHHHHQNQSIMELFRQCFCCCCCCFRYPVTSKMSKSTRMAITIVAIWAMAAIHSLPHSIFNRVTVIDLTPLPHYYDDVVSPEYSTVSSSSSSSSSSPTSSVSYILTNNKTDIADDGDTFGDVDVGDGVAGDDDDNDDVESGAMPDQYARRCIPMIPTGFGERFSLWLTVYTTVTQYVIPLSCAGIIYTRIAFTILGQGKVGNMTEMRAQRLNKIKRRRLLMLVLIVAIFAICWLPFNVYYLLLDFGITKSYNHTAFLICLWMATSSVCYNPFVYCWLNDSFRKEATNVWNQIKRFCCCCCLRSS